MDGNLFSFLFILAVIAGFILFTNYQKQRIQKSAQQRGWTVLNISWGGPWFNFPGKGVNSQGFHVEYEDEKGYVNERACEVGLLGNVKWAEKD